MRTTQAWVHWQAAVVPLQIPCSTQSRFQNPCVVAARACTPAWPTPRRSAQRGRLMAMGRGLAATKRLRKLGLTLNQPRMISLEVPFSQRYEPPESSCRYFGSSSNPFHGLCTAQCIPIDARRTPHTTQHEQVATACLPSVTVASATYK